MTEWNPADLGIWDRLGWTQPPSEPQPQPPLEKKAFLCKLPQEVDIALAAHMLP